ncbi:MAG: murein biosynthesis integral membrane protein MurJ [Kiritimatiellae bacterium]|nr:murein biosynthesis integral membrane protein MurJ [Kiritimatiellia bacterium]
MATGISRGMGMFRDVLMAGIFGTSTAMSAFVTAFRMPNLFRALFGEGALSAAFIPVFVETREKQGQDAAWSMARKIFTLIGTVLFALAIVGSAGSWIVAQWGGLGAQGRMIAMLLAIMLPYLFFICIAAVGSGLLNSLGHFFIPAATPWILNAIIIIALLWVCPSMGAAPESQVYGVAWAVVVAGLVQAWVQFPPLRVRGFRWRWDGGWRDERVLRVARLMGPVALARAVTQVNVLVDSWLAVWIAAWAPAALFYSERLIYLPLGIFATALSTVLLPLFSGHAARGDHAALRGAVSDGLRWLMFLMVPAAIGLAVLGEPICQLLFERREFTAQSTLLTVRALRVYAPGMIVFSLGKVFVPAFYALQDPKTPVRVGIATVVMNIGMSVLFMLTWPLEWKHAGIAAATVISEAINGIWMSLLVHRRLGSIGWGRIGESVARTCLASAGMAAAAWKVNMEASHLAARVSSSLFLQRLSGVAAGIAAGIGVYLLMSWILRSPELREMVVAARHRRDRPRAAPEVG